MPSTDEEDLPPPPKRPAASRKMSKTGSTSSSNKSKGKGKSKQKSATPAVGDDDDALLPAPVVKKGPRKGTTAAGRKRIEKQRKAERTVARGGVESSSEELDAPAATGPSAPRPKRKATKRPAREVFSSSEREGAREKRRKED